MSERTGEKLVAGLFYLGAARAGAVCMNLVATSRLAHALGVGNFGLYSFAVSYLSYFMIVVNLGYETFLTREIAFDGTKVRHLVDSMVSMRLLLCGASAIVLFASLWMLDLSPLGRTVVLIQSCNLFSSAIGLTCVYQGLQRMRVVAVREFVASFINMAGIIWLVHAPDDIIFATIVSASTFALVNVPLLVRYAADFGAPRIRLPHQPDLRLARQSLTYFWSVLMITTTYNMHIVLLQLLRTDAEVGLFSAGWKLFNFAVVLPNLISTLFMPRIAQLTTRPFERARSTEMYMQAIILAAVPITFLGAALIPQILSVLFGPAYLAASLAVLLLLLNGLVVALNIGFGTPLIAVGRQKSFLRVVALGAGVGVALNLVLIPIWGIDGAAAGTLADELMILTMFIWDRPEVSVSQTVEFGGRCLLAVVPAMIIAHFVPSLPQLANSDLAGLLAGGGAGALIYVLALRLMRVDLVQVAVGLQRLQ